MPIISSTKSESEQAIYDLIRESEKKNAELIQELEKERRETAKKTALYSGVALIVSIGLFATVDSQIGLLCAIIATSIPSFVNLVDD